MKNGQTILKFWKLKNQGKTAALDISDKGELICQFTVSNSAEKLEGNGSLPGTFGEDWRRIMSCVKGEITKVNI